MYEQHTYYYTCTKCGANLDPGESCDCERQDTNENVTEKCDVSYLDKEKHTYECPRQT